MWVNDVNLCYITAEVKEVSRVPQRLAANFH